MNADVQDRLTQIETHLSRLFDSRHEVLRYYGAAFRYFLGILRDLDEATELTQAFAERFLRGDFKRHDPERGRFRDFLKKSLRHMVIDHWRKKKGHAETAPLPSDQMVSADWPGFQDEETLLRACQEDVLARTWEALAREDKKGDTTLHTILKFKIAHPDMRTRAMAKQLGPMLKKPMSDDSLRQALHRARSRFAELLLEEVAVLLGTRDRQKLEDELVDLKLLDYCRSGLDRWRP